MFNVELLLTNKCAERLLQKMTIPRNKGELKKVFGALKVYVLHTIIVTTNFSL